MTLSTSHTKNSPSAPNEAGFTLIELLLVISIIGLLSSILLVGLSNARIKGRDAKRIADLKQINTALELYVSDNGHYPIVWSASGGNWSCFDCSVYANTPVQSPNANSIAAALAPYMPTPKDPKLTSNPDGGYLYLSDGTNYKLMAWRTPENMKDFNSSVIDPTRCTSIDGSGQCSNNPEWGPHNSVGFWTPGAIPW